MNQHLSNEATEADMESRSRTTTSVTESDIEAYDRDGVVV
jgi:hypothetical protein